MIDIKVLKGLSDLVEAVQSPAGFKSKLKEITEATAKSKKSQEEASLSLKASSDLSKKNDGLVASLEAREKALEEQEVKSKKNVDDAKALSDSASQLLTQANLRLALAEKAENKLVVDTKARKSELTEAYSNLVKKEDKVATLEKSLNDRSKRMREALE